MAFKILGITDEKTECECCGKTNLKCTVALDCVDAEGNETGVITYYGRDCASKAIRGDNKASSVKIIESEARGIEYARKWLNKTPSHTALVVASACRVRHCPASVIGDAIHFAGGAIVC